MLNITKPAHAQMFRKLNSKNSVNFVLDLNLAKIIENRSFLSDLKSGYLKNEWFFAENATSH